MKNVFSKVAVVLGVAGLQMACSADTQAVGEAPGADLGELAPEAWQAVSSNLVINSVNPPFVTGYDEGQEMTIYGKADFYNSQATAQTRSRGVALVEDLRDAYANTMPCSVNTTTWTDNCCAVTGVSNCCASAANCGGNAPSGQPWTYVYCVAPEGSSQPICLGQVGSARNIQTITFQPYQHVPVVTPTVRVLSGNASSSKYYSLSQSSAPSTSGCVSQRNNPAMCARALNDGITYTP